MCPLLGLLIKSGNLISVIWLHSNKNSSPIEVTLESPDKLIDLRDEHLDKKAFPIEVTLSAFENLICLIFDGR